MSRDTSRHHRCPRSLGGRSLAKNISKVCSIQHKSWHNLFANYTPQRICRIINKVWIDPSWKFICVKREANDDS